MRTIWRGAGLALALGTTALALPGLAQEQAAAEPDACIVNTRSNPAMEVILQERGISIDDYGLLCARLRQANMGVDISSKARQLDAFTAAFVDVRLYDLASGVRGDEGRFVVASLAETAPDTAEALLLTGLNSALENLAGDLEIAIASVDTQVERMRLIYQAPIVPVIAPATETCAIANEATQDMHEAFNAWGGIPSFDGYNALCEALRVRGAGLRFAGSSGLQEDRLFAWSRIVAYDLATGSTGSAEVMALGGIAGDDAADPDEALYQAVLASLQAAAADSGNLLADLDSVAQANAAHFTQAGGAD